MGGRSPSGNHELDNEVLPGEPLDRQPRLIKDLLRLVMIGSTRVIATHRIIEKSDSERACAQQQRVYRLG